MSDILRALAAAVQGGAGGAASGLNWIDQNRDQDRQRAFQREQFNYGREQDQVKHTDALSQLQLQRDQLTQNIAEAKSADEHNAATQRRNAIDSMIRSLGGNDISLGNPDKMYDASQSDPSVMASLTHAASAAGARASAANHPVEAVTDPNVDKYGGAVVGNRTFNPYAAATGQARVGATNLKTKIAAFQKATAQIEAAKTHAYQSFAANPNTPALLKTIDGQLTEEGRRQAEIYAKTQIESSANAELNNLKMAFRGDPDVEGLTLEALMGMGARTTGGAPSTSGSDPLGFGAPRPAASAPHAAQQPAGNPADPLGFGAPRKPPVANVLPPQKPPVNQNDPLGFGRRPPGF